MRQRVTDAIGHKATDMVPWQIELTNGFIAKVKDERSCADVDEYFGNHLFRLKYKKNEILDDGTEEDLFGVRWMRCDDGGDVGMVSRYPLKAPSLEHYSFPVLQDALCSEILDSLKSDTLQRFRIFSLTMNFFERSWSLRGMENILMDMLLEGKFAQTLYDRILEHHLRVLDTVLDGDYEAIYFGDDWGQQQGLIMGPDLWRKYIKPPMKIMFDKIKSKNKKIILHSCGDLRLIMGELIDMGLDVYNTVQPEIYDLPTLKREYGKDLAFFGAISTQQFLPFATEREVYDKSMEVLKIMSQDGGYIFSPTHTVTDDIPVGNIDAMIRAVKDFSGVR